MDPLLYDRLCTSVEEKFGVTPQFLRAEEMLGMDASENLVMVVEVEGTSVAVEVPDSSTRAAVDRVLGDVESRLVKLENPRGRGLGQAKH